MATDRSPAGEHDGPEPDGATWLEYKGIRMSDGVAGAVFGPPGVPFPWRDVKDRGEPPEGLPSLPAVPAGARGHGLGQTPPATALAFDRQILAWRAIRKLHRPVHLWLPYPDAEFSFETRQEALDYGIDDSDPEVTEDDKAQALADLTPFAVCEECARIEREQSRDRGYEHADWPCATATTGGWADDQPQG
jgi:hypothetical protein